MKRRLGLLVPVAAMLLTGCATVFGPRTHTLTVNSEPTGARVFVADADSGVTPVALRLQRSKYPVELRLEMSGYQAVANTVKRDRLSALLWLDVLAGLGSAASAAFGGASALGGFAGGLLVTAGIDFLTGAALKPSVRELRVTLPVTATTGRSP